MTPETSTPVTDQQSGRVRAGARAAAASALAVAVLVAVAGCSGAESKSGASSTGGAGLTSAAAPVTEAAAAATSAAGAPPAAAAVAGAAAATTGAAASAAAGTTAAGPTTAPQSAGTSGSTAVEARPAFQADPTAGRSVIYTATLDLQVATPADVTKRAQQAADDAYGDQGYVFSRDAQAAPPPAPGAPADPADVATADVTLKVPPAQFGGLINELTSLGKQLNLTQTSQDVTDKVVDTTARLSAQRASVQRMQTLLQKAVTIGQVVEVEGQLTEREAALESMEGELNVLKSQTAMATITVHLSSTPPKPTVVVPPKAKPKKHIHGFVGGLDAGGRGFATAAIGVATVLGALLPFIGLALVVALLAWWGRRLWLRSRRSPGQVGQVGEATP